MLFSNVLFSFGIAKVDIFSLPPNFFANFFNIFHTFVSDNGERPACGIFKRRIMDIDLLSKMVKELILENDRVVLPGLGCFVAEIVPSTFSDKGYTINPPYRRLFFRAKPDQDDALTRFYAESNKVSLEVADKIITDFVAELKTVLHTRKTVAFPGLGRLRATKENNVFFVADAELDIYPDGFGLEPISLKSHQESEEEVTAAVEELKSILVEKEECPEPVPETVPEPVIEPEPEVVIEPALQEDEMPVEVEDKTEKKTLKTILWVVFAAVVALVVIFMAVAHVAPELLDKILYTPEELEILNYKSE